MSDNFIFTLLMILVSIPVAIVVGIIENRKREFYEKMAKKHNLVYKKYQQIGLMKSFRSRLFRYEKTIKTEDVLEGTHKNHTFFIFTKIFYVKNSIKKFTVGTCDFGKVEFPYILLKSKHMPLYQKTENTDNKILLEEEYLKTFDLYCPKKYEIEILQIFTKSLLKSIQTISDQCSIEFGGNRLYIYIDKDLYNKKNEKTWEDILRILKEIIDKTDGLLFRLKDDFEVLDTYFKK